MAQFLDMISDIKVVIAIGVVIFILVVWLLTQKIRSGGYRKRLSALEKRYNEVKGIPLSLKVNKVNAIGQNDAETAEAVEKLKASYEESQKNISAIADSLADIEDNIQVGKLKAADQEMVKLDQEIAKNAQMVKDLEKELDEMLEKETMQRQEITSLKNRFRTLKANAQENAAALSFSWTAIEKKLNDTEKKFSTFEEWMYSSDYDKANEELNDIRSSVEKLEEQVNVMPDLLKDARGVIPSMAESLHHSYIKARNRGVYLKHLDVEKNLSVLTQLLKTDLQNLKAGRYDGVAEHLEDYKKRIRQMEDSVRKEAEAADSIKSLMEETDKLFVSAEENAAAVKTLYAEGSERFALENIEEKLKEQEEKLESLNQSKPAVMEKAKDHFVPATTSLDGLRELHQNISACNEELRDMRSKIEIANGDEDRVRKQVVKLQIIMNQMQVKIRKYKLPKISDTYEEDMNKANDYIHRLQNLLNEKPMNMQLLTSTLQDALDFIYKLYNNVNNVVGTVVMVENTIVFGNRYRSTYADIDSELTRAELCFRNGEYTQALTIAIATIEKIHPGNYESMIKENARSAA